MDCMAFVIKTHKTNANKVAVPQYKPEVIEAMEETKRISKAPETKNDCSFREALEEIEE